MDKLFKDMEKNYGAATTAICFALMLVVSLYVILYAVTAFYMIWR